MRLNQKVYFLYDEILKLYCFYDSRIERICRRKAQRVSFSLISFVLFSSIFKFFNGGLAARAGFEPAVEFCPTEL